MDDRLKMHMISSKTTKVTRSRSSRFTASRFTASRFTDLGAGTIFAREQVFTFVEYEMYETFNTLNQ